MDLNYYLWTNSAISFFFPRRWLWPMSKRGMAIWYFFLISSIKRSVVSSPSLVSWKRSIKNIFGEKPHSFKHGKKYLVPNHFFGKRSLKRSLWLSQLRFKALAVKKVLNLMFYSYIFLLTGISSPLRSMHRFENWILESSMPLSAASILCSKPSILSWYDPINEIYQLVMKNILQNRKKKRFLSKQLPTPKKDGAGYVESKNYVERNTDNYGIVFCCTKDSSFFVVQLTLVFLSYKWLKFFCCRDSWASHFGTNFPPP